MDRVRRLLVAIVVVVVAALVVLVVAVRPGLRSDADAIDESWKPLIAPLDERYQALRGVADGLTAAGVGDRNILGELTKELDRWAVAHTGTDAEAQVTSANRLEALAARAGALAGTARLLANEPLHLTFTAFQERKPAARALARYNDDVVAYQEERDAFWSRIVARLDGYPMRPVLQLSA